MIEFSSWNNSNNDKVAIYPLDLELAYTDMVMAPALPVSVIGYPLGLTSGDYLPIWKTGHIASDPDIDFQQGSPAFLIDATTKGGMSGSPVVMRLTNFLTKSGLYRMDTDMSTRFLGIYSGRIQELSDIGKVWRPFVIKEILENKLLFSEETRRIRPNRNAPCPCGSDAQFKNCCGKLE